MRRNLALNIVADASEHISMVLHGGQFMNQVPFTLLLLITHEQALVDWLFQALDLVLVLGLALL
jgi:hypothetical protein